VIFCTPPKTANSAPRTITATYPPSRSPAASSTRSTIRRGTRAAEDSEYLNDCSRLIAREPDHVGDGGGTGGKHGDAVERVRAEHHHFMEVERPGMFWTMDRLGITFGEVVGRYRKREM